MQPKEVHLKRFFEVVEEKRNKIWTLTELKEKINLMLPSNVEISRESLALLINNQKRIKVFRCLAENNDNKSKKGIHYIFKRNLNG